MDSAQARLERLGLSPGSVVGLGRFEANDRFARFGVAQSFPGEPFDGLGIIAQGIQRGPQLFAGFLLLLAQGIEPKDLLSIPFVLLNERQIPDGYQEDARDKNKKDHHPGQFIPDAKINFHRAELNTGRAPAEANKFTAPATERNGQPDVNKPKWCRQVFDCQLRGPAITLPPDD
jgi:hypothetical protein